ncbi:MAG: TonB-dependent receptor [Caulobacter sp.]|nr:TonB-dependent receptor [Caulobacter sp.]
MRLKTNLLFASASALGLIATAPALAQQTAPVQPSDAVAEVVVTGFKQSYANEVRTKRNAIEITDGISSDDLGRIPDLNIGEALQRVPGIQINREAEGRDATVNLRGLPGEFARTTLNGVAFAEPILQSSTPLGAFLSDVFSAVRIEKSPMAHAQAGGVSGNIDLQIQGALSRRDGGRMKASYDYNELGKRGEPSITLGYNKHITDNFAVFGVAAYKHENFRRDSVLFNSYGTLTTTLTPDLISRYADYYAPAGACTTTYSAVAGCVAVAGGTGKLAQTGVQYVAQSRQYTRVNVGDQFSGAAGAEWQVNDELKIGVTGLFTRRTQSNTTQNFSTVSYSGTGAKVTPTGDLRQGPNGSYYIQDFNFSGANLVEDSRLFPQTQKAWGFNPTIEYKNDRWRLSTIATISKASNASEEQYVTFNRVQVAGGNGIDGSFSSGGGDFSKYRLAFNSTAPMFNVDGNPAWIQGSAAASSAEFTNWYNSTAGTPNRLRFQISGIQAYATSKIKAIQQDVERQLNFGPLTSIQVGGRFERSDYASRGSKINAVGIQSQNIKDSYRLTSPSAGDFFGGSLPGMNTNWRITDVKSLFKALQPVTPYEGAPLAFNGFNQTLNDDVNIGRYNFDSRTDVASGYVEGKYASHLFSVPVRGSVGVRYEHTDKTMDTLNRIRTSTTNLGSLSDYAYRRYEDSYGEWLPSAIAVFDVTDNFLVRTAAYRTYVRPHPRQFSPVTLVGTPNDSNVITATLGNAELQPYTATSLDLAMEWYNRPGGLVSLTVFQKRLNNFIQQVSGAKALCPADGGTLGLGPLSLKGDLCYTSAGPDASGDLQTVNLTGYVNSATPYTLRGAEFNVQQNLDFLPGFWRNFGGAFNYAYTVVDGKGPTGAKVSLPGISKHNFNVIGYYETDLFGVRLTYNYRTDYDVPDAAIFGFGGAARRVMARGQLDGSASFNLRKGTSISISAFNITNSVRQEYQGIEAMARRQDYDGRTFRIAFNSKF